MAAARPPPRNMVQGARDLVDRARHGDQNAMALLSKIGEEARGGRASAKISEELIRRYIADTPVVGSDPPVRPLTREVLAALRDEDTLVTAVIEALQRKDGLEGAAVALANGPVKLVKSKVEELAVSAIGSDAETAAFVYGVKFPHGDHDHVVLFKMPPHAQPYARVGQCLGRARAIQALRAGQGTVKAVSSAAGWELEEDT